MPRLRLYYALNPEKWPDQVIATEKWPETAAYFEECGYAETYRTADGMRVLEKP